jgi:hypothetical protein
MASSCRHHEGEAAGKTCLDGDGLSPVVAIASSFTVPRGRAGGFCVSRDDGRDGAEVFRFDVTKLLHAADGRHRKGSQGSNRVDA